LGEGDCLGPAAEVGERAAEDGRLSSRVRVQDDVAEDHGHRPVQLDVALEACETQR
jgi:hypothetical protein